MQLQLFYDMNTNDLVDVCMLSRELVYAQYMDEYALIPAILYYKHPLLLYRVVSFDCGF